MESSPQNLNTSAFAQRPPSQAWEQLAIPWSPGGFLWAWFKPAQSPTDLIVRVPDELWPVLGTSLTIRNLLSVMGMTPAEVQFWSVQGITLDPQAGNNPLLDQPLPPPVPWADSSITIRTLIGNPPAIASQLPMMQQHPTVARPNFEAVATPMSAAAEQSLAAMEADWNAILQLETQLGQLRKQLNTTQGRLQSLNRDFSPDERQAADSNDVKNWQDARRFLRDASGIVSRFIREHDIGVTSAAGQRNRFEEIYKTCVVPRIAFEGIAAVQHEMESYRKQVQALLTKMQTALSNAGSNGEQRAQQVLNRVNAKMRKARNR